MGEARDYQIGLDPLSTPNHPKTASYKPHHALAVPLDVSQYGGFRCARPVW